MSETDLKAWIGRGQDTRDIADPGPIRRLAALLDHDAPPWAPGVLPPLGHWLYFLPETRQTRLGPDGHEARGGFLPSVELPRRMWAGGRIDFVRPIPFGVEMQRRSTIANVAPKAGASGPMVFVTVRHEIFVGDEVALSEDHEIVYLERPAPGAPPKPATAPAGRADFVRSVAPGPVELFRYSALTFNGHRIHYDHAYAEEVEGYPGLVVHGPLIATLLIDALLRWRPAAPIRSFAYRARSPLFDGMRFNLCVQATPSGARLWAQAPDAPIAMEGEATLAA